MKTLLLVIITICLALLATASGQNGSSIDPLTTISELERVKFVMKGGEVYRNEVR